MKSKKSKKASIKVAKCSKCGGTTNFSLLEGTKYRCNVCGNVVDFGKKN